MTRQSLGELGRLCNAQNIVVLILLMFLRECHGFVIWDKCCIGRCLHVHNAMFFV